MTEPGTCVSSLIKYGILMRERTLEEAHRWAQSAVDALAPLPDGPVKKALVRFADTIVERSS